jgi:hypothetical protein
MTSFDPGDPRWQLTQRVMASPVFEKSPRLRAFLTFICELELSGRRSEINEQQIGIHVFGRPAAYNPGEDSIVRSQARFLRQRLDEYFRTVGGHESMRLSIPKGSYVPLFEINATEEPPAEVPAEGVPSSESPSVQLPSATRRSGFRPRRWLVVGSLTAAILVGSALGYLLVRHRLRPFESPVGRFWNTVFDPRRPQVIVPADSTLILIEELTGRQVSLQDYLNHSYLTNLPLPNGPPALTTSDLAASHYTSMADLNFVARIMRVPALRQIRAEIRNARDLTITDAKEDNLVLIGGPRANPWVELFSSRMNFYVDYDGKTRQNSVINKAPRAGEAALYVEGASGTAVRVYGLIAFQPSLDREGDALLAAGTSSAGTQAAADFLTSGPAFDEFLRRIQRPDGSIPHFEVLLEARNLGGNIAQSSIVTYRLNP